MLLWLRPATTSCSILCSQSLSRSSSRLSANPIFSSFLLPPRTTIVAYTSRQSYHTTAFRATPAPASTSSSIALPLRSGSSLNSHTSLSSNQFYKSTTIMSEIASSSSGTMTADVAVSSSVPSPVEEKKLSLPTSISTSPFTSSPLIDIDTSLFLDDLPAHYAAAHAFYKSIGSPKTVCAPMVNQSDLPFRMLVRNHGAELCYTPMIHSQVLKTRKGNYGKMFGTCTEDRPLFAQFCGDDPEVVLWSAKVVQDHVDAIDLNFGCPQQIAKRGHYGAFLLEETRLVQKIVRTLHDGLKVPVTVKMRMLLNDPTGDKTIALARALQDSGASVLTIHGRTREMIKQRIAMADFAMLRRVKASLSIPVFVNGGIETMHDVRAALHLTGADAVMVSEALLNWPGMFNSEVPKTDLRALVEKMRAGGGPTGPRTLAEQVEAATASATHFVTASTLAGSAVPPPAAVVMPDPLLLAQELLANCVKYPGWDTIIRPHLFKMMFRELSIHTDIRTLLSTKPVPELPRLVNQLRKAQLRAYKEHLLRPADPLISTVRIYQADGSFVWASAETTGAAAGDTEEEAGGNCNQESKGTDVAPNGSGTCNGNSNGNGNGDAVSKKAKRGSKQAYPKLPDDDDDEVKGELLPLAPDVYAFLEALYANQPHWYRRHIRPTAPSTSTAETTKTSSEDDAATSVATTSLSDGCGEQGCYADADGTPAADGDDGAEERVKKHRSS